MQTELSQIVAEKMNLLTVEDQEKVVKFVLSLTNEPNETLIERIGRRVKRISDDTLRTLPVDGAENLDKYLYKKKLK